MVKLQRMATLSIMGGMKSTPTDLLDAHAGLLPMELTLQRICHRAALRLCSLPPTHPLHPLVREASRSTNDKHPDPIRTALKIFELNPRKFETLKPDTTPQAYYEKVTAKTLKPDTTPQAYYEKVTAKIPKDHEEAIAIEAEDDADFKIYTDGSEHNGRVGAAAVIFRRGAPRAERSLTYHLGASSNYTIADAELVGALLGLRLLCTTPGSARRSFSMYTDSQTVVHRLTSRYSGPGSHIVDTFREHVDLPLKIFWIPSHNDVLGNTEADDLAYIAARGQSSPIESLPPLLQRPLPFSAEAEK
jgi:ribonuclease HI